MSAIPLESLLRALADRTRLRILGLLSGGELCVCYFVEILGEPQPKISRHLAYLRRAGLVTARRDGKWMHYKLVQSSPVLDAVLAELETEKQVQKDRTALERACRGVRVPAGLQHAPAPSPREAGRGWPKAG